MSLSKPSSKHHNPFSNPNSKTNSVIAKLSSSAMTNDYIGRKENLKWLFDGSLQKCEKEILVGECSKYKSLSQLFSNQAALRKFKQFFITAIDEKRNLYKKDLTKSSLQKLRLTKLRKVLSDQKLDYFLFKRNDPFLGEYIGNDYQTLAYLTGFSGSFGYAIIGKNNAWVFVDSRYTEQAKLEINPRLFKTVDFISNSEFFIWITENLKSAKVGFCDKLISAELGLALTADIDDVNFVAVDDPFTQVWPNLSDNLTTGRPPAALSRIFSQDQFYAGRSAKQKIEIVNKFLKKNNIDSYLVCEADSISYLLNLRAIDIPNNPVVHSYLILNNKGLIEWFVDEDKLTDQITKQLNKLNLKINDIKKIDQAFSSKVKPKAKIALAKSSTPYYFYKKVAKANRFEMKIDFIKNMKSIKVDQELIGAKLASKQDSLAFVKLFSWISSTSKKNITERNIKNMLEKIRKTNRNYLFASFDSISAMSENSAIPHYRISSKHDTVIPMNSIFLLDAGGQYVSGTTDQTRTIYLGKTPTLKMKRCYTYVLKSHLVMTSQLFPLNVAASQVDAIVRSKMWQAGLGYNHGTGHGIGNFLNVHEGPVMISSFDHKTISANMIFSNEPGCYYVSEYGFRIENLVISKEVEYNGKSMLKFENITFIPYDRKLIDKSLLDQNEIKQINDYHKQVFKIIKEYKLDEGQKQWLSLATERL